MNLGIEAAQLIANLRFPRKMPGSVGVGTYGSSASGSSVKNGTATITAGNMSVVVAHTLSGTPKITLAPKAFVVFRVSVDATNLTIEIDAPQGADVNFDWMATL